MRWPTILAFHFRSLFRRAKLDAQLSEEMRTHVEMATEANVAKGMSPDEARYAALREFGNVASLHERAREERLGIWLEQLGKDAVFALRSLLRARAFTLTVIGTLSLGIGVATVVFKLVAPAILFTAPFPDARRLHFIYYNDKNLHGGSMRPWQWELQLQAYRDQTAVFSEYAAVRPTMANALVGDVPVFATVQLVSPDSFHTLEIRPVLGRAFLPEEFGEAGNKTVILSDRFWRKQCNADPAVLGRNILLDQQSYTVVGVLGPGQAWPMFFPDGDIFQPMPAWRFNPLEPLGARIFVVGRLKPGISADQAESALQRVLLPELPAEAVRLIAAQRIGLVSLQDYHFPNGRQWLIAGAALLLYLTACLNAVNLMLVRLLGRRRELSIRLALGGARTRIVRLLALESIALALGASAMVSLAAYWVFPFLLPLFNGPDTTRVPFLDWSSFGCIAVLSFVACLTIVLLPAIRLARAEIQPGLKDGGFGLGESRRLARLRGGLVVLQGALAVILLTGTGLMVRSFERMRAIDLGINPVGLVRIQLAFPVGYQQGFEERLQIFERLQDRMRRLPGVKGATFGEDAMMTGYTVEREEVEMADGSFRRTTGSYVATDFYQVAGLKMREGRWFSPDRTQNEVVINETMARALYGERDPLEQAFKLKAYPQYTYRVVGVVHDVRESIRSAPGLRFFAPCWWYPPLVSTLVLRLERDPEPEFLGKVRQAIYEFDPHLLAYRVGSFGEHWDETITAELLAYRVLRTLAAIALGLAMVGMFSTVAYTVDCKRREFGVRLALGALPGDLRELVLKRSLITAATGTVIGIGAGLALSRFMQSLLFETDTYDPVVYVGVAGLLLVMAVLACWLPARRAAKVDPIVALRAE